jgi:hypothetical protein
MGDKEEINLPNVEGGEENNTSKEDGESINRVLIRCTQ